VLKKNYNEKCDVWSVGVMMFILIGGKPPFDGDNDKQITDKVSTGKYSMKDPIWNGISSDAKDLIN